ncbi:protein SPA, chloroplastic isoform X2 [Carya illinoinensis]|uniref:protein SPA, chloroplastic isoform X2 n=1 Tax=Carya illinoinensis TaxID=32201 RepID=UPI001C7213D8|nr:protein SPA, chloroplastic isoform X2 [Carya illinoinensis]
MSLAPSLPRFHSPFLRRPLKLSSTTFLSYRPASRNQRSPASYPCIRAIDLDQNTVVAISVGLVSVAVGIGIPVFYETQIDNAAQRENTQPCFPCNGTGALEMAVSDLYSHKNGCPPQRNADFAREVAQ